jgi:uncharacterized protein (TIGR03083 family)
MNKPRFDPFGTIARHSMGLADAADGNLGAHVEPCPGWDVADLVWHLTEVHWFWATIAEERLSTPPAEERRPRRPPREELLRTFRAGAERLVRALSSAPPEEPVWTWAPAQQDIAFISRHQVQEAAVHHWDAVRAVGGLLEIEAPVAADAIDEFLTFSVSSDIDPAQPARASLQGRFALRCTDADAAWTISDGRAPGTLSHVDGAQGHVPTIVATASELLLWLYRRIELDTASLAPDLLDRFRSLCFTD